LSAQRYKIIAIEKGLLKIFFKEASLLFSMVYG
jgi:hypothetical protein